jgi:hypothetical protein
MRAEFAPFRTPENRQERTLFFLWVVILAAAVLWSPSAAYGQCGGCPCGEDCYCSSEDSCSCVPGTPIILDLDGNGFNLTSPAGGVLFNFFVNRPVQIAWTAPGANEGWLVLPQNGQVQNGAEMFGNLTPQPPSNDPNGFLALAVYDLPQNGGNGNGMIDAGDAIFSQLRVWRDFNHDGIVEPGELIGLSDAGIKSISLAYTEAGYVDKYGNRFRYKSTIVSTDGKTKLVYDVILQFTQPNQARNATGDGNRTARAYTAALAVCFAMVGILFLPRMRT